MFLPAFACVCMFLQVFRSEFTITGCSGIEKQETKRTARPLRKSREISERNMAEFSTGNREMWDKQLVKKQQQFRESEKTASVWRGER